MLLIDLTHTSHSRARTGVQRVARRLHENLTGRAIPVTRDPFLGVWRALEHWELANLHKSQGGEKRQAQWPVIAKWRSRIRRALGRRSAHAVRGEYEGLIVPELFSSHVARDLPSLFQHVRGPRVAIFHDAIPLRFPELTPPRTVARFPGYMRELLMFDGIAATSKESCSSLVRYWSWLGVVSPPPTIALSLGVDPVRPSPVVNRSNPMPVVLSVGTLEGRKNHLALLDACAQLWTQGKKFELRVIGHVNAETGGAALARLRSLQQDGRPLRFDGPATDEQISAAYVEAAFTVYPSIIEGFGLPVIESLARGKTCVCSGKGALGEISRDGGCVPLDTMDASAVAGAIASLLDSPAKLATLNAVAASRRFKTWGDYTSELTSWMRSLPRR
jgi:glycosyltransferase involved in cell wall biosynthesis